jgi:cold shock CspA family protein
LERVRTVFSAYLATEDEKFVSVPATREFLRQATLRNDTVAHWSGVRRTEDAEAIALYGTVAERVNCKVDWFDAFKGFGFVQVESQKDHAFLPVRVVQASKVGEVHDGDDLVCDISRNEKGLIVSAIHEIIAGRGRIYEAVIIRLFEERGYGFVHVGETKLDAFFHYSLFPREEREDLRVGLLLLVEIAIDADGKGQVKKATVKGSS